VAIAYSAVIAPRSELIIFISLLIYW